MSDEPEDLIAIGGPMHGKRLPDRGLTCMVPRNEPVDYSHIGEGEMPPTTVPADTYRRMKLGSEGWQAEVYMWDMKGSAPL